VKREEVMGIMKNGFQQGERHHAGVHWGQKSTARRTQETKEAINRHVNTSKSKETSRKKTRKSYFPITMTSYVSEVIR